MGSYAFQFWENTPFDVSLQISSLMYDFLSVTPIITQMWSPWIDSLSHLSFLIFSFSLYLCFLKWSIFLLLSTSSSNKIYPYIFFKLSRIFSYSLICIVFNILLLLYFPDWFLCSFLFFIFYVLSFSKKTLILHSLFISKKEAIKKCNLCSHIYSPILGRVWRQPALMFQITVASFKSNFPIFQLLYCLLILIRQVCLFISLARAKWLLRFYL